VLIAGGTYVLGHRGILFIVITLSTFYFFQQSQTGYIIMLVCQRIYS